MSKWNNAGVLARLQNVLSLVHQAKVEDKLHTFLLEPHAELRRRYVGGNYVVVLTVAGKRVAGAESATGYVDALGNALWALELWRAAEAAEAVPSCPCPCCHANRTRRSVPA